MSCCKRLLYTAFDVVPAPKGASRHITHFTRALVAAGYEVTLLTAGDGLLPASGHYAGARIVRVDGRQGNFLERALAFGDAVYEHLRQHNGEYELVHFRDIWSGTAALEARRRFGFTYRTLFEANGLPSVELKYHYPALKDADLPARLRLQEQDVLRQVEAVVCVSAVTAIFLRSLGAAAGKIQVIHNGVDPADFPLVAGPAARPDDDQPRLVYSGTLAPWQGIDTLIQAMPGILIYFAGAQLHLVGPGKKWQRKRLIKLAAKLGLDDDVVIFHEPITADAVARHLAAASLCVAPLAYDDRNVSQGCCPIKLLEYAAVGRPILVSDLPVARELLAEGEARFFSPGDADDLARQAVELLLDRPAATEMGCRAANHVRREFTWQRSGEQLAALVRTLLNSGADRREPAAGLLRDLARIA
ncbi:MAG: glycosyltransferase family 4 protein [Chloroflexota bacterium]